MTLPPQPARRLAVLTCMDCRIDPLTVVDLELGDAHVLRNAGGVVTDDVLRSLALSQRALGTNEVMVIQHEGCGVLGKEEELRANVGDDVPGPLLAFPDLEQSVRDGVARIRDAAFLAGAVRGYVLSLETGELREVS